MNDKLKSQLAIIGAAVSIVGLFIAIWKFTDELAERRKADAAQVAWDWQRSSIYWTLVTAENPLTVDEIQKEYKIDWIGREDIPSEKLTVDEVKKVIMELVQSKAALPSDNGKFVAITREMIAQPPMGDIFEAEMAGPLVDEFVRQNSGVYEYDALLNAIVVERRLAKDAVQRVLNGLLSGAVIDIDPDTKKVIHIATAPNGYRPPYFPPGMMSPPKAKPEQPSPKEPPSDE